MEARQRLKDDFEFYARNCLHIRTKHDGLQPLILNQAQKYIHSRFEAQLKETGKVRAIILKGRQQGASTLVQGRYVWQTESLRLWVPVPQNTPEQEVSDVFVSIEVGEAQAIQLQLEGFREKSFGSGVDAVQVALNDIKNGDGRSLCIASAGRPVSLELSFEVTRREARKRESATDMEIAEALQPDGMIPLDGDVAAVAASLKTPADKLNAARELYDHTLERMRYDKPAGGGWGRGDAELMRPVTSTRKFPARVNRVSPLLLRTGKNPSPLTARSVSTPVLLSVAWEKSVSTPISFTPPPTSFFDLLPG